MSCFEKRLLQLHQRRSDSNWKLDPQFARVNPLPPPFSDRPRLKSGRRRLRLSACAVVASLGPFPAAAPSIRRQTPGKDKLNYRRASSRGFLLWKGTEARSPRIIF